jgi:hypothetical protein
MIFGKDSERIYPWVTMRQFRGTFNASAASKCNLCLADCTISTCGFDWQQAQQFYIINISGFSFRQGLI